MRFILMVVLAVAILSIIMCGDDKGLNPSLDNRLIGTWTYDSTYCNGIRDDDIYFDSLIFRNDGSGSLYAEVYVGGEINVGFGWKVSGGQLIIRHHTVNGIPTDLNGFDEQMSGNYQIIDSILSITYEYSGNCTSFWGIQR